MVHQSEGIACTICYVWNFICLVAFFTVKEMQEWPYDIYPPWAHGPGYIISRDIAKFVVGGHQELTLQVRNDLTDIHRFPIVLFSVHLCRSWLIFVSVSAIQTRGCGDGDLDPTVQEQRAASKHRDWWPVLQWRMRCWLCPCALPEPKAYDVPVGEA